jgi:hypothetical protein
MQAITTKYHGPTNTRGARITATSESGIKVTLPYPHELTGRECHDAAVRALCHKIGWTGQMVAGAIHGGGYAYVFLDYLPGEPVERVKA